MKRINFLFAFILTVALFTVTVVAKNLSGYNWPIEYNSNYQMSQEYRGSGEYNPHHGIDISAPYGTTIKSAYSGTVICSSMKTAGAYDKCSNCGLEAGYHVIIKQDDGLFAAYAHMSKTSVSIGQKVSSGEKIGEVGSTGYSSGNHLHFAFFPETNGWFSINNSVNPIKYLTPFSNVYAAEITSTNAMLYGLWGVYGLPVQNAGFYIGTSLCSMKKINETQPLNLTCQNGYNGNVYNLNKYYGTLKNNTTYFFQLWITINGIEYKSDYCKFITGKANWSQYVKASDIPKHSYIETSRIEASCSETGYITKACTHCNESIKESISATNDHIVGEWTIKQPPTATSEGLRVQKCTVCDVVINSEAIPIDSHTHTYDDGRITLKPTATTTGTKVSTCTVCGHVKKEVLEKISESAHTHTYDSGKFVKATTTQPARVIYTCTICGYTETKITDSSNVKGIGSSAIIVCDTVMKETAIVDGILDNAYTSSMQVKINPPKYAGSDTDVRATVYTLYDDDYVYVFYQVENDTTLLSADDDYIQDHPMPSNNDAVELRIADDLEGHLPEYTGSNAAHHLFIMDAYGKRFSNYEDSIENYVDLMKGASKITSATSYTVEMAIPVVSPFNEGDIIQFNFQIDDCQNAKEQKTGYIGLGKSYTTLVDFKIGGELQDSDNTPSGSGGTGIITFLFPSESPKADVTGDNAILSLRCNILETNAKDVEMIGVYLYDKDRNPIESKTEKVSLAPTTYVDFCFDVQNDLGVKLNPNTTYNYVFLALSHGEPYYSPVYTFTTEKQAASLDNFRNINSFDEKVFPDIKNDAWYSANAKKAYQVGLMNGNEKGFDATADITIAQVITLAARLHSIYNYGAADFVQGAIWYEVFVNYCIENGIIEKGEYTDFNRAATRSEFVDILYASLPTKEFSKLNEFSFIPDITPIHPNYNSIYSFYQAGILAGSDSEHTFFPERSITRSETAAILTRIIDKSLRLSFK